MERQRLWLLESSPGPTRPVETARLRASVHPMSGLWLHALPSSYVGTLLPPNQFQACACLRLGARLCDPHLCAQCGARVDASGTHGLSCGFGQARHARHAELNRIVAVGLSSAGIPNRREPLHLVLRSGKRPDGVTLVPFARGRCVTWDVTVVDTVAASYVALTSSSAGAAARAAESRKRRKYEELQGDYDVVPLAFETMGPLAEDSEAFIRDVARRIRQAKGADHDRFFLQRLSIALQRGNAACVMQCLPGVSEAATADDAI